jgi:hypothetical protein
MSIPGRQLRALGLAAGLALAAACGGDSTGPGNTGDAAVRARVDGANWASLAASAVRANGFVGIGANAANGSTMGLGFPDATGTYTMTTTVGLNASYGILATGELWMAVGLGAQNAVGSGTVVVTELTAERVRGTFNFVAPASQGSGATGTRTVTEGTFDVRF